jgi:hypothetical protein
MSIEQERLLSLVEFAQQSARLRTTPASTITQHGVFALYEHQVQGLPGITLNAGNDGEDEIWLIVERLHEPVRVWCRRSREMWPKRLYLSDNLSSQGRADYRALLRNAAETGTDATLAAALQTRLNEYEKPRQLKSGQLSKPPVMRVNAHEMLAEGEFNRFYARGLCARAIADGIQEVEVYRGKQVTNPRPESEAMIGRRVPAQALLDDLRTAQGVEPALGLPPGPNSGLTVRLP